MKHALLILTLLLCCGRAGAQRNVVDSLFIKEGAFGIDGGLSLPVIDYGEADLDNIASGFAKPGYNIRLYLTYEFMPLLGLKLQYFYNKNGFDASAYLEQVRENAYADPRNRARFDSYRSDDWVIHGVMAGLFIPLRTIKTTYTFGASIGYMSAILPESQTNYVITTNNREVKVLINEGSAHDPAYSFSAGIKRVLHRNLLITGQAEFFYSEQLFRNITGTELISGAYINFENYTQYYHILSFTAGLAYQFH